MGEECQIRWLASMKFAPLRKPSQIVDNGVSVCCRSKGLLLVLRYLTVVRICHEDQAPGSLYSPDSFKRPEAYGHDIHCTARRYSLEHLETESWCDRRRFLGPPRTFYPSSGVCPSANLGRLTGAEVGNVPRERMFLSGGRG